MNANEDIDNIFTLKDENGQEIPFEFLDVIEYGQGEYVVLLPISTTEDESGEVVILKVESIDGDEEEYVGVEDEDELNAVFEIFRDKFKDKFDFLDDDD